MCILLAFTTSVLSAKGEVVLPDDGYTQKDMEYSTAGVEIKCSGVVRIAPYFFQDKKVHLVTTLSPSDVVIITPPISSGSGSIVRIRPHGVGFLPGYEDDEEEKEDERILTKLYLPATINHVDATAFQYNTVIQDVYCTSIVPPIVNGKFSSNLSNSTLHVPIGTKKDYANATGWCDFGNIIEEGWPTEVEENGRWYTINNKNEAKLFYSHPQSPYSEVCVNIPNEIEIKTSAKTTHHPVTTIGKFALPAQNYVTLHLGNKTSFLENGFDNGTFLRSISVTDENETFGSYCGILYDKTYHNMLLFPTYNLLKHVATPYMLKTICANAIQSPKNLKYLYLPKSLEKIEDIALPEACSLVLQSPTPPQCSKGLLSNNALFVPGGCIENYRYALSDDRTDAKPIAEHYFAPSMHYTLDEEGTIYLLNLENFTYLLAEPSHNTDLTGHYDVAASVHVVGTTYPVTCIGYGGIDEQRHGYCAPFNGTSITSVSIPETITSIHFRAFYGTHLSHIVLPSKLTFIGEKAFAGCQELEEIDIPENVTEIRDGAFMNCTHLQKVIVNTFTPIDLSQSPNTFAEVPLNATLTYPIAAENLYRNAPVWKRFFSASTTGVSTAPTLSTQGKTYDLQGRPSNTSTSGIYIIDRKKTIIK